DKVQPYLEQGGLHAFLDIYTGAHKSNEQYQELMELGLRRISLGVESGCEALLEFVQKPGTREEIVRVVTALKTAGLAVVVILMVGLGGERYRRAHLRDTVSLVRSLPLDRGDIVYLSQFDPTPAAPYRSIAEAEKIVPLSPADLRDEVRSWKTLLDRELGGCGIKIAPYSFQRFLY
ncbi:MAG: radical SAM protein, partial [Candidatus Neomarinimicrobiota bacterium]